MERERDRERKKGRKKERKRKVRKTEAQCSFPLLYAIKLQAVDFSASPWPSLSCHSKLCENSSHSELSWRRRTET